MEYCVPGPMIFSVEPVVFPDTVESTDEFPRPRGPMRSSFGRMLPKPRPNHAVPAVPADPAGSGTEDPRLRGVKRTVMKSKLEVPKGRKRASTKAVVKKKRGAAAKKSGLPKTTGIPKPGAKGSNKTANPEGSTSWLFCKKRFCSDPQAKRN
ncbi:uncharacterized protein LOC122818636 [Drosophila biarmipes]|uniref:uncharacterized protein LOC122818636 n=1 Tax=Drosophila biarmipes TaxID=125945 RepID=UPI0021CC88AA|nr:uncharacterized protein LOC122818636 [Drosophila biarmipes]